jgi:hypothetical protein
VVETDLRRAARVIIHLQDEIDSLFRIASPECDLWPTITLPRDAVERVTRLALVRQFVAIKQAICFTIASVEPDAVYCAGVTFHAHHACLSRVRREPRPWTKKSFGLPDDAIDDELVALLPRGATILNGEEIAELETWFGADGRFPMVQAADGTLCTTRLL